MATVCRILSGKQKSVNKLNFDFNVKIFLTGRAACAVTRPSPPVTAEKCPLQELAGYLEPCRHSKVFRKEMEKLPELGYIMTLASRKAVWFL
jgi:hypothetical protein